MKTGRLVAVLLLAGGVLAALGVGTGCAAGQLSENL